MVGDTISVYIAAAVAGLEFFQEAFKSAAVNRGGEGHSEGFADGEVPHPAAPAFEFVDAFQSVRDFTGEHFKAQGSGHGAQPVNHIGFESFHIDFDEFRCSESLFLVGKAHHGYLVFLVPLYSFESGTGAGALNPVA